MRNPGLLQIFKTHNGKILQMSWQKVLIAGVNTWENAKSVPGTFLSALCILTYLNLRDPTTTPTFHMGKQRLKEVKLVMEENRTKWRSQDLNPGNLALNHHTTDTYIRPMSQRIELPGTNV